MNRNSSAEDNTEAVQTSHNTWLNFVFAAKLSGGVIVALLILMAVFLV